LFPIMERKSREGWTSCIRRKKRTISMGGKMPEVRVIREGCREEKPADEGGGESRTSTRRNEAFVCQERGEGGERAPRLGEGEEIEGEAEAWHAWLVIGGGTAGIGVF